MRLSICVVGVATGRLLRAGVVDSGVSFNDRLCFVTCHEESWTCVTNDRALRRLCTRHGVQTRIGLSLVVDLVACDASTTQRAMSIACEMHESNPLHINARVLARFKDALDRVQSARRFARAPSSDRPGLVAEAGQVGKLTNRPSAQSQDALERGQSWTLRS